tara:strand:+ start:1905 stop:2060 length:156 start_codon:yes stop_codon:yes gene_type:complete
MSKEYENFIAKYRRNLPLFDQLRMSEREKRLRGWAQWTMYKFAKDKKEQDD